MTQPAQSAQPAQAGEEDGVAAEVVLNKIVASGELGRALVERGYYAALADQRAEQMTTLRAELADLRGTPGDQPGEPPQ